jgi:hypothetical protein
VQDLQARPRLVPQTRNAGASATSDSRRDVFRSGGSGPCFALAPASCVMSLAPLQLTRARMLDQVAAALDAIVKEVILRSSAPAGEARNCPVCRQGRGSCRKPGAYCVTIAICLIQWLHLSAGVRDEQVNPGISGALSRRTCNHPPQPQQRGAGVAAARSTGSRPQHHRLDQRAISANTVEEHTTAAMATGRTAPPLADQSTTSQAGQLQA